MTRLALYPEVAGFFQFLDPCPPREMGILESWERWFESRGIRTQRRNLNGQTVLYRENFNSKERRFLEEHPFKHVVSQGGTR